MKKITIELPDDVDIMSTTYISSKILQTWVLTSTFAPKDGLPSLFHQKGKAASQSVSIWRLKLKTPDDYYAGPTYGIRDKQLDPPVGYCVKCGGEIYDPYNMSGLCAWCEDEEEGEEWD